MPSVIGTDKPAEALKDAIDALAHVSRTPVKQRKVKASTIVDDICSYAFQDGLDTQSLRAIVNVVAVRTELDQTSTTNLVKSLYPVGKVPSDVVITVVGGLGSGNSKPPLLTQTALLKWLVLVSDVLEDATTLSRLYDVLFDLLDTFSLRAPLCHLLAIITRRKHVRVFRIQQLLELTSVAGVEPPFVALLNVYKNHYPDVIVGAAPAGRTTMLQYQDHEWRKRLQAIQEVSAERSDRNEARHEGFKVLRNGTKRSKITMIPRVHTLQANESSVTLEEIDNVDDLVEKLERIELPSQILSALQDPLLQQYVMLRPSEEAFNRLNLWLAAFFEEDLDQCKRGTSHSAALSEILKGVYGFVMSTRVFPPAAQDFLERYLPHWDGTTNARGVLGLLSYMPLQSFTELQQKFLNSAEVAVMSSDPEPFDTLLTFYINLARDWTVTLFTPEGASDAASAERARRDFAALIEHVATLVLSALSTVPASAVLHSLILSFYEILSSAGLASNITGPQTIPIRIPNPHVVYLLAFSTSLSGLSRLCSVLATYKRAFEGAIKIPGSYSTEHTMQFNGYLMDICNLLWRSRALLTSDTNALGCLCSEVVRTALQKHLPTLDNDYSLSMAFGLSHNNLVAALARATFSALEDKAAESGEELRVRHAGPVTQRSLMVLGKEGGLDISWKQYRIEVLNWLEANGVGGIKALMYTTMKDLIRIST